jgi:hypothetical protein
MPRKSLPRRVQRSGCQGPPSCLSRESAPAALIQLAGLYLTLLCLKPLLECLCLVLVLQLMSRAMTPRKSRD